MKIYFRIFRVVLLFNYQGSRSLSDLFTLTFLYQCYWLAVCVSDIYLITFALACQELFYFIFWSLPKNKILEIFLISCFRTNKKLYAFTLCFLSLFATAICILQHLFDIVKNFFSFNFIIFKRNQITFRCAISQSRQRIKFYHIFGIMSRTFFHYEN